MCEGNSVSVPFCNEQLEFSIKKLVPVGQGLEPNMGSRLSFNTSRNLTLDSLQHDLSGLCLGGGGEGGRGGDRGGGRGGEREGNSPASMSRNIISSTPGMDVDENLADSGPELDGLVVKPAAERGGYSLSLDQQMQGLALGESEREWGGEGVRSEASGREEAQVEEVTVGKITPKTRIVFTEKMSGSEVRY